MSDDKGPLLRNSCYVFMALVTVLATMRFYVRLRLQGQWKFHDWLFTFALVRMLSCFLSGVLELTLIKVNFYACSIVTIASTHFGLGRHMWVLSREEIVEAAKVSHFMN